jgi:hypothetical protein
MIREYEQQDEYAVRAMHEESGFDYRFPDLSDPLFIAKLTAEQDGRAVQAIALKLQAEVYLWVDHSWGTPEQRWGLLKELTEEAKIAGWLKGLDSLVCVVPPEIADTFEKRLEAIGMTRDRPWPKFSISLLEYIPNRVESSAT